MKIVDRIILCTTLIATVALFCIHFSVTLLYVFPLNPLKAQFLTAIYDYTGDLFSQNWSLFAPTPVHTNLSLLVQCRTRDGHVSPWYDLSGALIDGLHRQPFGPYVRLVRMPLSALRNHEGGYLDEDSLKVVMSKCQSTHAPGSCEQHDPTLVASTKEGTFQLQGLASAVCADGFPGNVADVKAVETSTNVRPWSERNSTQWRPTTTTVNSTDWLPLRDVAPIHFTLQRTPYHG